MLVDIDIDSDYWDLPVLREAIAARVWGAANEDDPYGPAPTFLPKPATSGRPSYPAAVTPSYPMAVGSSYPMAMVPAARSGGGRHRRAVPVG